MHVILCRKDLDDIICFTLLVVCVCLLSSTHVCVVCTCLCAYASMPPYVGEVCNYLPTH